MTYEAFLEEALSKGLLKKQKADIRAVEKLLADRVRSCNHTFHKTREASFIKKLALL
jgi:hypothetical protein